MTLIGLISDTHGLVRPKVAAALAGVCRIVHAGDIGKPEVLDALSAIAPVTAVRGNVDHGLWTAALPADAVISVDGHGIYVMHNLNDLEIDPKAAGITAVIYGHTHEPLIEDRGRRSLYQSRQRRPAPLFPAHLDWVSAPCRKRGPRGLAANHRGLERGGLALSQTHGDCGGVPSPIRIRLRMRTLKAASSPRRACWERDRARGIPSV